MSVLPCQDVYMAGSKSDTVKGMQDLLLTYFFPCKQDIYVNTQFLGLGEGIDMFCLSQLRTNSVKHTEE